MAEIQVVEVVAKPLPEKVFQTEKFGISRKTHEEHYKLYQGYVNKTNEIRKALSALTADDFAKGNQTYSLIRSLKVDYTWQRAAGSGSLTTTTTAPFSTISATPRTPSRYGTPPPSSRWIPTSMPTSTTSRRHALNTSRRSFRRLTGMW